ncbi:MULTISPECIES: LPS export ABC transporter periplasmic protein LptC [Pseudomonas]|uniref:LPS export ABC transporter periplasmic protein LptC n=1 Tax=Pseudomonadaceae TaxID=135621 RepID=UPI0003F82E3A|nr:MULTISPECIES: LPS export ABC transporter periplasmic protein LptC [Pseudomonas]MDE3738444.1 LPS export ABC transporter periplasmic protein LptC [Pseudomonas resinovorans]
MSKNIRLALVLIPIAALLVALGYWNISPESFMDRSPAAGSENAIDFYVENGKSTQFQEDGKIHYELTATHLEHIKATDVTLLTSPDLLLHRGTAFPWHVQSERGEVGPEGKQVELIDKVRVARTDAKGRPTLLTTSRLTVFPDEEYAQTQQAVRIEAANGVTTAQGMKAYLNDSRMILQSNVRGQHEVR